MHPGAFLHPLNHTVEDQPVPLDKIFPALLESFGIIFLGYVAGK